MGKVFSGGLIETSPSIPPSQWLFVNHSLLSTENGIFLSLENTRSLRSSHSVEQDVSMGNLASCAPNTAKSLHQDTLGQNQPPSHSDAVETSEERNNSSYRAWNKFILLRNFDHSIQALPLSKPSSVKGAVPELGSPTPANPAWKGTAHLEPRPAWSSLWSATEPSLLLCFIKSSWAWPFPPTTKTVLGKLC